MYNTITSGTILDFIGTVKHDPQQAISFIKENNIDPNYSENILSDYALIHSNSEEQALEFCHEIRKIGGHPESSQANIKTIIKRNYTKILNDFLEHGLLSFQENKEELPYFFNIAILENSIECFEILAKHTDFLQLDLEPHIPSPTTAAIGWHKLWAIEKIAQAGGLNILTTKIVDELLGWRNNSNPDIQKIFTKNFFEIVLNHKTKDPTKTKNILKSITDYANKTQLINLCLLINDPFLLQDKPNKTQRVKKI